MEPVIIAVSGFKNAGKTTLIEALLPRLSHAGLRVAVIKHDGHRFTPDTPGTDSFRFFQAGACAAAVFDDEKYTLTRRTPPDHRALIAQIGDADLVLLEGFKHAPYPRLALSRTGADGYTGDRDTYIAQVGDVPAVSGAPLFSADDIEGIAALVLSYVRRIRGGV